VLTYGKKGLRAGLAAVLLTLVLLAGCSSVAAVDSQAARTVTFWHDKTGVAAEALEQALAGFREQHPEITVNAVYAADLSVGGGQKLLTAIAGGNAPDAVFFDRFQIAAWAEQGALTDLSGRVAADAVNPHRFYSSAWDEVMYGAGIYGLPVTTDGRVLFYNKEHFALSGLDPDRPPTTIAQLEEYAERLTISGGAGYERFGFVPWLGQGSFYTWGWAFGGSFLDEAAERISLQDERLVSALEWLQHYAEAGDKRHMNALAASGPHEPFASGLVSMEIGNNLLAATIRQINPELDYAIAPIPVAEGSSFRTWSGGYSMVIPKGARNEEDGWSLVKYFTEDKAQQALASVYLSVVPALNERLFADDPVNGAIVKLLPRSYSRPVLPQGQLLWNELAVALDMAVNGKGEPRQLLELAEARVNAAAGIGLK
jgi:multiple sugar transport system substrate-binding protein